MQVLTITVMSDADNDGYMSDADNDGYMSDANNDGYMSDADNDGYVRSRHGLICLKSISIIPSTSKGHNVHRQTT